MHGLQAAALASMLQGRCEAFALYKLRKCPCSTYQSFSATDLDGQLLAVCTQWNCQLTPTSDEPALPGGRAELPAPLGREGTCGLLLRTAALEGAVSGAAVSSEAESSAPASGRFLDARACSRELPPAGKPPL